MDKFDRFTTRHPARNALAILVILTLAAWLADGAPL